MKIVFERRTAMQFEFVSFDSSCDESSKPKSGNLWHHVVNISLEPFRNIFRKIWGNYTAMQFEFDSFMSCCDDSSNPKSLITAWFSLLFFCRSSLHSDLRLRMSFGNCTWQLYQITINTGPLGPIQELIIIGFTVFPTLKAEMERKFLVYY